MRMKNLRLKVFGSQNDHYLDLFKSLFEDSKWNPLGLKDILAVSACENSFLLISAIPGYHQLLISEVTVYMTVCLPLPRRKCSASHRLSVGVMQPTYLVPFNTHTHLSRHPLLMGPVVGPTTQSQSLHNMAFLSLAFDYSWKLDSGNNLHQSGSQVVMATQGQRSLLSVAILDHT